MRQPPGHVAREHHRTGGAEQVAGGDNGQDEKAAPVDRCEDCREIARRELRTEEAVQDDGYRDEQQNGLERGPRVAPAKE